MLAVQRIFWSIYSFKVVFFALALCLYLDSSLTACF
jgi:hypothetical protein